MISMSGQILSVDLQIMVCVQFPELAVDHVEMLVWEIVSDFVDVGLFLQRSEGLEKVTPP